MNLEIDLPSQQNYLKSGLERLSNSEFAVEFGTLARTLTSILDEVQPPQPIDLLSLDVEGVELEVLKGIDFDKWPIAHIFGECRNLNRLTRYLAPFGCKIEARGASGEMPL